MIRNNWVSTARNIKLMSILAASALMPLSTHADTHLGEPRSMVVKYGDLDLSTEAGVHRLYRRIVAASERVCPDNFTRDLETLSLVNACRADAVAHAIETANNPKLAALHLQSARHG